MNYVAESRALVGTRPLLLAAAGVLILNPEGHLLLQRRTDDHLWGIPGGSMEIGKRIHPCLKNLNSQTKS